MAEEKDEPSPLEEIGTFLRAVTSRYGRVPALKKLGRLIGKWFLAGLAFVLVCIVGESVGVGFRKAREMYFEWWVWPPVVIALFPIGFVLALGALEAALYVVLLPLVLVGDLIGRRQAAFFQRASKWMVYAGIGFLVAWAARDSSRKDATPKPAGNVVASAPAAHPMAPAQAPTQPTPRTWFEFRNVLIALGAWVAGIASHTLGSVTSTWAKRVVFDEGRDVVLYGPNDRPDP